MNITYTESILYSEYLGRALCKLKPGCLWEVTFGKSAKFIWYDSNTEKAPTNAEVAAVIKQLEAADKAVAYIPLRAEEYPPLEEFVDAYYWSQRGNDSLMTEYLSKCDKVKTRYPKPGV